MKARTVVALLVVVLAFYLVLIGVRGVELLGDHRWAARGLGVGVLILPFVGAAAVARELRFGRSTERLGRRLGPEPAGRPDLPELRRTPGGRIDTEAADAVFAVRRAQVQDAPADWRAWYRLGLAYGDARDTTRGRQAMRRAIELERSETAGAAESVEAAGAAGVAGSRDAVAPAGPEIVESVESGP